MIPIKRITKIKLRRGSEDKRRQVIFEDGECVFITDKEKIYVGNEFRLGGDRNGSKNLILSGFDATPIKASEYDLIYDQKTDNGYLIQDDIPIKVLEGNITCCEKIQSQIDDIYTKLAKLRNCCDEDLLLATDSESLIQTDKESYIKVKDNPQ